MTPKNSSNKIKKWARGTQLDYHTANGEGNGAHSSALAWRIPWVEEPGGLAHGSLRVGHDWVTSLSCIGEGNGTHSSALAWKIPWMEEPGRLVHGLLRVRHDWATSLSCIGEGNGNPLQCSCLENPRDGGSLVGCRLWGRTESDTTEVT